MATTERPLASAGRAAAFVFSAVATSTAVPLGVWLVGTELIAREEVFALFGIYVVGAATVLKLFRLRESERGLPPKVLFDCAAARIGITGPAASALFWILLLLPVATVTVVIARS